MNTIPDHFTKNGYHYRLIERTAVGAIYSQSTVENLPPNGKACAYEVVRVRVRKERQTSAKMGGFSFPGGEYLPGSNEWGRHGWTFDSLAKAQERLNAISATPHQKPALPTP